MAFGSFAGGNSSVRPMAEINMIPLIDVMLVLLVIFIITAPLLTNAVKIDLPQASSSPNLTKPDNIQLAIDGAGDLFWNGERIAEALSDAAKAGVVRIGFITDPRDSQ
jgi:biopolymer transport protein ExbD